MMQRAALFLIRMYRRYISPLKPASCRFTPTCSAYALQAVERFGALRGGLLALRRVLRCHPYNPGGFDPVPLTYPGLFCRGPDAPRRLCRKRKTA